MRKKPFGRQDDHPLGPVGVRIHYVEDLQPEDVTTVDGIPVTTPARTLLDLATCVGDEKLEEALANGLNRGLTTRSQIQEVMARYPNHRGGPRLRALLGN